LSANNLSVALSASEAVERSLISSHERHNILHDLNRTQTELESCKAELSRQKEEINQLRDKIKSFNMSKLASDRKVAETMTANSRLEVWNCIC
jgi:septal ring factor EnvC (AmiA/AmiB activator)